MPTDRLTFQIRGDGEDDGDVRFDDFLKELDAIRKSLVEMDRVVGNASKVFYRIYELARNSPPLVGLEAGHNQRESIDAGAGMKMWMKSVAAIQQRQPLPECIDYQALMALKEVAPSANSRLQEVVAKNGHDPISLQASLARNIEELLGPDECEIGTSKGMLEQINIHQGQNVFTLYPTTRRPKLRCLFPSTMKENAVEALGHHVQVYGTLCFHANFPHPYEMRVREIEVLPDDATLPTLTDLRGIMPDATGGMRSVDFVREARNAW